MQKNLKFISALLCAVLTVTAIAPLGACAKPQEEVTFFPTVTIAKADGSVAYTPTIDSAPSKLEISLLSGEVYEVGANYEKCITEKYNKNYGDCYAPTPLTISWECDEQAAYYTLDVSTNADMSNPESYVTFEDSVTLNYLFMGYDYYYRISAKYEDRLVKSRIFEFSTSYLPRTVYVDEAVSNTRDWGGYRAAGGMRVKQGIVYRGGALENITADGKKVMLEDLGIKTDLDVRGDGSTTAKVSPLGKEINYIEATGPYYVGKYGAGIDKQDYQISLATEIRTFANPANFPVYVHCSLGRDRTGTLCFLISALLGVSERDIYMDYELSMLSRLGKTEGGNTPTYMVKFAFSALYDYILNFQEGKTLQENAAAYMLSIGITQAEIDAIKANMLEKE